MYKKCDFQLLYYVKTLISSYVSSLFIQKYLNLKRVLLNNKCLKNF